MGTSHEFPELNSFSTILRFAIEYEAALEELCDEALSDLEGADAERVRGLGKKLKKRHSKVRRILQEGLNELILEPVGGLNRDAYLPPELALPQGAGMEELSRVLEVAFTRLASFYRDSAEQGKNALGSAARTFKKLAAEAEGLAP